MDSSENSLHIQKIEELVYDNGEIITAAVISSKFGIKVNEAYALMEQYVKDTRKYNPQDLAATYVVIGANDNNEICIAIAKESELDQKRNELKDIISEKLYSVQKSKNIDINSLAVLEPFGSLSLREKPLLGSIVSQNAVKRKLKSLSTEVQKTQKDLLETRKEIVKPDISNGTNKHKQGGLAGVPFKEAPSKTDFKKVVTGKKSKQLNQKSTVANFFTRVPSKPSPKQNAKVEEAEVSSEKKIEGLDATSIPREVSEGTELGKEIISKKHKLTDSDTDEDVSIAKQVKVQPKQIQKAKNRNKRQQKDKTSGQPSKKRRRIVSQDDSESDDIFGSENEDGVKEDKDIIECSDHESESIFKETAVPAKKKIRKKVSDMFLEEEEGYFQTVNKWEVETISEEEKEQKPVNAERSRTEENNAKKPKVSPPKPVKNGKSKTAKAPPQNQPSIMNFFKKK